ncbi:hypothetical protein BGZ51_007457 [Haplosporangium sp. Z 767]|nr:hypothetical protein BGZ51_007457 [Haplosporangium sp. Z 767]
MTRARQLKTNRSRKALSNSLSSGGSTLRHRRPKTNDSVEKEKRIRLLDEAIVTGNVEALRKLSVTGPGFVNDGIRRRAWSVVVQELYETVRHKDEEQVRLDVIRSFTHIAGDTKSQQSFKRQRQDDLLHVIMDVLQRHPKLAYYQGFHDVCTCLIIVLGKESAKMAAETLAMFFFRDCMLNNLEPVLDQLSLMAALFRLEAPEIQEFLDRSETLPFFPLSWVITWCSHDLQDFEKIARIYDFLICFNPLMSVYLTAAVVMSQRDELFQVECDNAMVHTFLTKFPKDIDLEQVISHAHRLYMTYPPEALQNRSQSWLDDNKPGTRLYDDDDEKTSSNPVDFEPIDKILDMPRVKKNKESSALSKYSESAIYKYRKNMIAMVALSAASMGTATLLLLNSGVFREWLNNSGFY